MVFDGVSSALLSIGSAVSLFVNNTIGLLILALVVIYTIFFFVLQYYLIKLYIKIYTTIKEKTPFIYDFIRETLTHEKAIKEGLNNSRQND